MSHVGGQCFSVSMEHSHTHRPGSGRPRSTDVRKHGRTVRTAVAARTASREESRAHVTPAVLKYTEREYNASIMGQFCFIPSSCFNYWLY